jgi:hypothetical protein
MRRPRSGVSALPHIAMTAIVPYCRIEHNPGRLKKLGNRKEAVRGPAD